jgi:outer membrane protein assembly factor BamB
MALYDFSQNYVYTGFPDVWVKPDLITSAYFIVRGGGGGGSNNNSGGNGAYVYANFRNLKRDGSYNVVINVGGGGKAPPTQTGGISVGGFIDSSGASDSNGGEGTSLNGLLDSGGGGGMSSVFYIDPAGTRAIEVVAGGGGGGGTKPGASGGASGGIGNPVDANSAFSSIGFSGNGINGGQGGNTNLLGNAGVGGINGGVNGYDFVDSSGTFFYIGGAGGGGGSFVGGGGGAGYGGAAGGKGGGGGGGGSYTNANISIFNSDGGTGGSTGIDGNDGSILVLWNGTPIYNPTVVSQFMLNSQHTARSIFKAPERIPPSSQTKFYNTVGLINPNSGVIGGDNELYIIAGDGSLYGFDHEFKFKWRYTIPGYTFFGTPAIIPEGTLYVSATTNLANKYFFALTDNDTSAGKKWQYQVDSNPSTSPVLDFSGNIYFGTANGTIYALFDDAEEALLGWKYPAAPSNIPVNGTPTFDLSYNNLCYTDKSSINSSVYVLDLSTNHIIDHIVPTLRWPQTITNDFYKTPSIRHDISTNIIDVFLSTDKGKIYGYDISNGDPLWPGIDIFDVSLSEIAIGANNLIYCTSTNSFNVIDSSNGTLEWKYPIELAGLTPTVSNNSIPIVDASNNVYFGARNNYLYAIDGTQRLFKWRYQVGGAIQSMPIISNNSNIYFGANDGKIYDLSGNSAPSPVAPPIVQMYMLNPQHTGQSTYAGPIAEPTNINSEPFVSGNLFVLPSISISSNGIIYLGSNDGYVYAINSITGLTKWKKKVSSSANLDGFLTSPDSMYTTPALAEDGTIYIGSNEGYLYALRPADGSIKWSYYAGYPLQSSPIIDNSTGSIYFGAGTRVYAVGDAGDAGYPKWLAPFQTGANVNSSPALSTNGYLYFGSDDGYVYGVYSFTGVEKWRLSTNTTLPDLVHPIYTSATIDNSNNVIIGNGSYMDGKLYYLDGLTGTILWEEFYDPQIGPFYNTPAVRGDVIYLSTIAYVYAIDRLTGTQLWRYINSNFYYTSPIIDVNGKIYVASIQALNTSANGWLKNDGILHCLNPDGTNSWVINVADGRLATPVLSNNGSIYMSATDNKIYAIY